MELCRCSSVIAYFYGDKPSASYDAFHMHGLPVIGRGGHRNDSTDREAHGLVVPAI